MNQVSAYRELVKPDAGGFVLMEARAHAGLRKGLFPDGPLVTEDGGGVRGGSHPAPQQ